MSTAEETRIDVFAVHVSQGNKFPETSPWLSPQEKDRCLKFQFEADRMRAAIGASLLRVTLGRHLDIAPEEVELSESDHGKRMLSDSTLNARFNLSHSGDWVYLALCDGREIGIDVEQCKSIENLEYFMRNTFHPAEYKKILHQSRSRWGDWFYCCWTRKEALLKAMGTGFMVAPDRIRIEVDPTVEQQWVAGGTPGGPDNGFIIRDLCCPEGHRVSMAVAGDQPFRIHCVRIAQGELGKYLIGSLLSHKVGKSKA